MEIYTVEDNKRIYGLYLERRMAENYINQQLQDYGAEKRCYTVKEYKTAKACLDAYTDLDKISPQSTAVFMQLKKYYLAENNGVNKSNLL